MPRFLERGKYVQYAGLLILTVVCTASIIVTGYYASAYLSGKSFYELFKQDPANYMWFFKNNALPSTLASTTLGMSVKLTKNWIQMKRRQQLLEKEKLETELKFLRSQFNPHFLFNTINSIFVLIHKNPKTASDALAKFSDLLRYQLYDCNDQEIPLSQELSYLQNFIDLQKLRQDTGRFHLNFNVQQNGSADLAIAPFVLMPFIENAFKHVSQHNDGSNWIKMELTFDHNQLRFTIANSMDAKNSMVKDIAFHQGIGLKNVQRRLHLIYPHEHQLIINHDGAAFSVDLCLHLHKHDSKLKKRILNAEMRDH
jgi:LytS/YehU family sensor histidine kinase